MFDVTQGKTSLNLFWKTDSGILGVPTQEQVDCHAPKAILRGELPACPCDLPHWQPCYSKHADRVAQCVGDGCERRSQKSSNTLARTFRGRSVVLPTVTRTVAVREYHNQRYEANAVRATHSRCLHSGVLKNLHSTYKTIDHARVTCATYPCITSPNYTENYAPVDGSVIKLRFS